MPGQKVPVARCELEKTDLEHTYIYCGFFMDYFGMPFFETHMGQLYILVDAANRRAAISGDGSPLLAMACTKDLARYVAAASDLERWPRELKVFASQISLNQLVSLIEKVCDEKIYVEYDSIEELLNHRRTVLPSNEPIARQFSEGMKQLRALLSDLSASIGLGATWTKR